MTEIRKALGILALGALLLPAGVAAQDVLLGVKGGINSANVSVSDSDEDTSAKTGLVAGVFAEFGISDMFAIRPEALYSSKGFKATEGTSELQLELNYFEIPVLLVAQFGTSSVRPILFAGPVLSFESKCGISGSDEGTTVDVDCDQFPGEGIETKSTDFGAAFGAGLEADVGSVVLMFDGRYTLGLTNLDSSSSDGSSAKNRVWSFMAGLGFKIG
jgi:hypothetical protein